MEYTVPFPDANGIIPVRRGDELEYPEILADGSIRKVPKIMNSDHEHIPNLNPLDTKSKYGRTCCQKDIVAQASLNGSTLDQIPPHILANVRSTSAGTSSTGGGMDIDI